MWFRVQSEEEGTFAPYPAQEQEQQGEAEWNYKQFMDLTIHFLQGSASQPPAVKLIKVGENGARRHSSSQPDPVSEQPEVKKRGWGRPAASQHPQHAEQAP